VQKTVLDSLDKKENATTLIDQHSGHQYLDPCVGKPDSDSMTETFGVGTDSQRQWDREKLQLAFIAQ